MPYSIGLYFDQATDSLVRNLWRLLAEQELANYYHLSGNRPHITLAIFNDVNCSKAETIISQISRSMDPFSISFQQIGLFPSVNGAVFWGPVVTKELLTLHSILYRAFDDFSVQPEFDFYKPGHWIPHCGLAMEITDNALIPKIMDLCRRMDTPYSGMIVEIGMISFRPVKQLFNCKLGKIDITTPS